jgi:hypothetical protein
MTEMSYTVTLEHFFLQALCLYIHWRREILERSVYFTNKKIKDTLLALNHTRAHQSRVEAARARSTGYIFHEVRQPLNAACTSHLATPFSANKVSQSWHIKIWLLSPLYNLTNG